MVRRAPDEMQQNGKARTRTHSLDCNRSAERGPTVRNVLVWSIGLVAAAFVVIYFLYFKA
jgi:hypothetical protein